MKQSGVLEGWMHRAAAYELLSLAFLFPTKNVSEVLVSGEFAAACDEVFETIGSEGEQRAQAVAMLAEYEGCDVDEVFHKLRHEHTRLFIGEKFPPITPYVGVWGAQERGQQGMLFVGRDTIEIEHFMLRCGVAKDLAAGHTNDPVDHVGTMCEFLKFLCLVNAEAVQAPENASVEEGDFTAFLDGYFAKYAAWCSDQVLELTRLPFFRAVALLLKATISLPEPGAA